MPYKYSVLLDNNKENIRAKTVFMENFFILSNIIIFT